jgi:hypothetical protein
MAKVANTRVARYARLTRRITAVAGGHIISMVQPVSAVLTIFATVNSPSGPARGY